MRGRNKKSDDVAVMQAVRKLRDAKSVKAIAEEADLSPRRTSLQLVRLERLGLVNIHRVRLGSRWYVRHIRAVQIPWKSADRVPMTTCIEGLKSVEGQAV